MTVKNQKSISMKYRINPYSKKAIRKKLIPWFQLNKRTLPWRTKPSPYRTWISEIMAQQTRIETMVPYFNRFLKRFPTVRSLAKAPIDDVLEHWAGLGYYSRARNLHKAARMIVADHGGKLPTDPDKLRKLPGIGDYTAGAIASIAFSIPAPIVDGNVIRVLSRLFDIEKDTTKTETKKQIRDLAAFLVPLSNPGPFNEGLMELGATICTPLSPKCDQCPLFRHCDAIKAGTVAERPVRAGTKPPKEVTVYSVIIRRADGAFLLVQNPYHGLFGGLWLLPYFPQDLSESAKGGKKAFENWLNETFGTEVKNLKKVKTIEHILSHRKMNVIVYEGTFEIDLGKIQNTEWKNLKWMKSKKDLEDIALAKITEKALVSISFGNHF